MREQTHSIQGAIRSRRGFALPGAVFTLAIMSIVAVAALVTSVDEQRTANAFRQSGRADLAAQACIDLGLAQWNDSTVRAMRVADSVDLGWRNLAGGRRCRAWITRDDGGTGQKMYSLNAIGYANSRDLEGQRALTLTMADLGPGQLGACCEAAAMIRGDVNMQDVNSIVDGSNHVPTGWTDACAAASSDPPKPGLHQDLAGGLTLSPPAQLTGNPPRIQDSGINDNTFNDFGTSHTWDDIKAEANHHIGVWGVPEQELTPRPSYNADGTCNTADPLNWGSNVPGDPCYDYFPIILVSGDVSLQGPGYGQAVLIMDYNSSTVLGTELDFETGSRFNGIVLGKGCVEIQENSTVTGALFVDGNYFNQPMCAGDKVLDVNKADRACSTCQGGKLYYSQCAIDRALIGTGLDEWTEGGGFRPVSSRSLTESWF